jgi:hypothetical protein
LPGPSTTSDTSRPVRGDIFVARRGSGAHEYDLGIVPGPAQLVLSGREVATAWACEFGRRKAVDVWCRQDRDLFRLIVRHRVSS